MTSPGNLRLSDLYQKIGSLFFFLSIEPPAICRDDESHLAIQCNKSDLGRDDGDVLLSDPGCC